MVVYQCYYPDCIPPFNPNTQPPLIERPANAKKWCDENTWNRTDGKLPQDDEDVYIPEGKLQILSQSLRQHSNIVIKSNSESA